ncbi:HAD family phosphatase [Aerococcus sp. UMB8608]|uniref:HAD family hydrolase n=1 Tax=unclassified Aerococcus TaxID=2618060 RepID=UPI00254E158C|nr:MULTISPECIES: HAD family phosphatase [unclassified Aerococcus]MDK6680672.1 HAD family phosphatase [Aerococcus sp. UMB8608]MDK6940622.1 HAD family phosphatase [Aerococcus sp. UMB8487]
MLNQKTHLFFDMDGLLIDTERLYYETRRETLSQFGYAYTQADHMAFAGRGWRYTLARLQDWAGPDQGQVMFDQALERFRTAVLAGKLQLKPGVRQVLDFAQAVGLSSYVTSASTRYNVLTMTEQTGIRSYFTAYLCGEDIERSKPYPDLYLEALRRSGVEADRVLVLEDSPSGLTSAVGAGLDTVLVPDLVRPSQDMQDQAVLSLDRLDDLIPYLKN